FRLFNKESGHYSWWSYRFNARERNIGWRLDYFLVSNAMSKNVISSEILQGITGSDHAPVRLTIEI
ncbi:MAG: endonuclease/exonuclease/phosphatase family protein, partial [Thermoplasmataceae archaeon]